VPARSGSVVSSLTCHAHDARSESANEVRHIRLSGDALLNPLIRLCGFVKPSAKDGNHALEEKGVTIRRRDGADRYLPSHGATGPCAAELREASSPRPRTTNPGLAMKASMTPSTPVLTYRCHKRSATVYSLDVAFGFQTVQHRTNSHGGYPKLIRQVQVRL
jgi:hypothetical protein